MTLLARWNRWHTKPRRYRWPLKGLLFALVVAAVLYPKVWLLPTWVERLSNLDEVVDPNNPWIAQLAAEATQGLQPNAPAAKVFKHVEHTVYAHVPYAFDWDTWGVMDYLPTVSEVEALGREDCDGRAVVAASILRHLGYDAHLVTDLKHTWVTIGGKTPGELMSPGAGEKTLAADDQGTHARLSAALLANLGRGLAFGIAVFPLGRELIILAGLALLTLHPRIGRRRVIAGLVLMVAALVMLRLAGTSAQGLADRPWLAVGGALVAVAGWVVLAVKAADCRSRPAPPE